MVTIETGIAALDPQLFAQALAVLEREQPTRRSELLFNLLHGLIWAALALTLLYVVLVFGFEVDRVAAQPIAVAVAIVCVLSVPVSALNLGLLLQLRRAARLERRLAPSWRQRLRARFLAQDQPAGTGIGTLGLRMSGGFALAIGVLGLAVEIARGPDTNRLTLAFLLASFGVSAVSVPYMRSGRQRLRIVAELRALLVSGNADAYDDIARLDRDRISADRERSIRAEARRSGESGYKYRESREVREAKQALPATVLIDVLAHIDRLLANPPQGSENGRAHYERIEGTDLELAYTVDHHVQEIGLLSLAREGRPRPDVGEPSRGSDPQFTVSLPPSVASGLALSAEQRKAVDDIVGSLAEDPEKYSYLATSTSGGNLLRRHPSPPLEVTYSVDTSRKIVNVVHLSAPLPARRTLFISYCHEDKDDLQKVLKFVDQLEARGLVNIWSDDHIRAGERWEETIRTALDRAHGALLLVSQDFLRSDFINRVELPYLFARAAQNVTKIFWLPLTVTTLDESDTLFTYQSLLPPSTPLKKLEEEGESRRDEALLKVYRELRDGLVG